MEKKYQVSVTYSQRKTIALRIVGAGQVEVRAPLGMKKAEIEAFLEKHRSWIEKHMAQARERLAGEEKQPRFSEEEIRALGEKALALLPPRVEHFARRLGVTYGRITIRNQKTRWGSCSSKGKLNFNCLLTLCPPEAVDYVVIHELCHRKEMNHSPRFWALVEKEMPDYRRWRDWLKTHGQGLIERL